MRARRLIWLVPPAAAFLALGGACGDDPPPPSGVVSAANATSSSAGGAGGTGGSGGSGAAGGSGGSGAGGGAGAEDCYDGVDGDLDGANDCVDPDDDCAALCADPCSAPKELADPGFVTGDLEGFAAIDGSCESSGATSVYRVTASVAGTMSIVLDADPDFALSVRSSCGDVGSELACDADGALDFSAELEVTQGQELFVLVHGGQFGDYSLSVETVAPVCGDAHIDPDEECDDGNTDSGDGCSSSCALESDETEPNGDFATADAYSLPFFAAIDPAGDEDYFSFVLPADNYSARLNVFDLGNGGCGSGLLDPRIVFYDPSETVISFDDDSGDGLCSTTQARGLTAGTYYARVQASPNAPASHTFVYSLAIETDECGNNSLGGAEDCDDGNLLNGDGCSALCTVE